MSNGNEPAFPTSVQRGQNGEYWTEDEGGMTKREYFAVMATQPGVSEIVTAAGLHCPDNFSVWKDAETRIGHFNDWWSKLSNEERFRLTAVVRIQQADALLAELAKATGAE